MYERARARPCINSGLPTQDPRKQAVCPHQPRGTPCFSLPQAPAPIRAPWEPPPPPGPPPSQPAPPGRATNRRGPPRPKPPPCQQRASSIPTLAGSCAKFSQASWAPPCWEAVLRALSAAQSTRCWSWRARGLPSRQRGPPPLPVPGLPECRLGCFELRGLPSTPLSWWHLCSSTPGPFPACVPSLLFPGPCVSCAAESAPGGSGSALGVSIPAGPCAAGVTPAPPPPRQGIG